MRFRESIDSPDPVWITHDIAVDDPVVYFGTVMNPDLHDEFISRLLDDPTIGDDVASLVEAALDGEAALDAKLESTESPTKPAAPKPRAEKANPEVFLRELEVRAFRGIGATTKLTLTPGPGLTLVLGRNGSGKSSFAEAAELLMTGKCKRWEDKTSVWQQGWRNVHVTDKPLLRGSFTVEGSRGVEVTRKWDGELTSGTSAVKVDGQPATLDSLGWSTELVEFRPFLSYAELGAVGEAPSALYDQLEGILGLEQVAHARGRLEVRRKALDDHRRDSERERRRLTQLLADVTDERAKTILAALKVSKKQPKRDLDAVAGILSGTTESAASQQIKLLDRLIQVEALELDPLLADTQALREAIAERDRVANHHAEQAGVLAELLDRALRYHEAAGGDCPVCERPLDRDWVATAHHRTEQARASSAELTRVRGQVRTLAARLRQRVRPVDAVLGQLGPLVELGLDTAAVSVWTNWAAVPADDLALIAHVEALALELELAIATTRASAHKLRAQLHDAWQPIAMLLQSWLVGAREAERAAVSLTNLEAAAAWMQAAEEDLRNDKFDPIATQAIEIWEQLRQASNVSLVKPALEKSGKAGKKRQVVLDVTVDGKGSLALAVMSQGELNALALSLFLPRMTLPQTPFRFLLIDDPVQAMDPSKVDGLARVLAKVAETRQVVVFTHDTRLDEAVRRLKLEATVLHVHRRLDSAVEVVTALDPVQAYLADATAIVRNQTELGPQVVGQLIPSFCRSAIEAACTRTIRRRGFREGHSHEQIQDQLAEHKTVRQLAELALAGDVRRGLLNRNLAPRVVDTFFDVIKGAHAGVDGRFEAMIADTRVLANCFGGLT